MAQTQLALGRRGEAKATAEAVLSEAQVEFEEAHVLVRTARKILNSADALAAGSPR